MRLLFVYKRNPQDPCELALRRWLPRCGREVAFFELRPEERRRNDAAGNAAILERLCRRVQEIQPTHLLSWVNYLGAQDVRWLSDRGVRVSVALNAGSSFWSGVVPDQREYLEVLRLLDWYFLPHAPHVPILRDLKIRACEMPFFFDPDIYRPLSSWKRLWDIGGTDAIFIGNFGLPDEPQRAYRAGFVEELAKHLKVRVLSDFPLAAPGVRWQRTRTHPPLLNWLINRSRFAFCFDYFPDPAVYNKGIRNPVLLYSEAERYILRSRQFTMLGAGAAVMVERHPEIERLFEDGREIILWRDRNEAVERVRHYLDHPAKLAGLAWCGHVKARRLHTAAVRLDQMLTLMESPREDVRTCLEVAASGATERGGRSLEPVGQPQTQSRGAARD